MSILPRIIEVISGISSGFGNSTQLYGLAYLLLLDNKLLRDVEEMAVDQLFRNVVAIPLGNNNYSLIAENQNPNNYYVSHHYNYSLNLMAYLGLTSFYKRSKYRREEVEALISPLKSFLRYELKQLTDLDAKTIGFELLFGHYSREINRISDPVDASIIDTYTRLRSLRLRNFSPILAFSPEGLSGIVNRVKLRILINKGLNDVSDKTFIFNAPELSLYSISRLHQKAPQVANDLIDFVRQSKGLPPFFQGEFYDLFWGIDILNSCGLLQDPLVKESVIREIEKTKAITEFDTQRGFAIGKGFRLHDLDTTTMGIRAAKLLKIKITQMDKFDYSYYYNPTTELYHTYKQDNRVSPSVIAHTVSAQAWSGKLNPALINYLQECLETKAFSDKFHTSVLYTLYSISVALVDTWLMGDQMPKLLLDETVSMMLKFRKTDGSFSSLTELEGTIEETGWAVLSLIYIDRHTSDYPQLKKVIAEGIASIESRFVDVHKLEKLWIVKQIYTPLNIVSILIQSIRYYGEHNQ